MAAAGMDIGLWVIGLSSGLGVVVSVPVADVGAEIGT